MFKLISIRLSVFLLLLTLFSGMKEADSDRAVIIYINDPLCSWCYGFAPEATKIREKYKEVAEFRLVEGGLRPGGTKPMDEKLKNFLQTHWREIERRTGQPFTYDILSKDFIYDTEPPCRAVVTMRKIKPEAEFDFLKTIQNAFYVKGKNTNLPDTYTEILPEGVDPKRFEELFLSEELKKETEKDFRLSDSLGITGFPVIMLKKGNQYKLITEGYSKFDKLEKQLDKELLK